MRSDKFLELRSVLFDLQTKQKPHGYEAMGHYFMERDTRFELATSTLARSHSTTELVPQNCRQSVPTDALYSKSPPNKSTEIFNLLKKISEQRHGKTSAGNQFRTRGLRQKL